MKNKKGIILIILSFILITIALIMIFTSSEEKTNDKKKNVSPPRPFLEIDARGLIYEKIFSNKITGWSIGNTKLIAHNKDNTKYLIRYEIVLVDGAKEEYESVAIIGEKKDMEFPGWRSGEKNLDEYNFIYYDNQDNQNSN